MVRDSGRERPFAPESSRTSGYDDPLEPGIWEMSVWLYVVWSPLGSQPEMVAIQDPATRLDHAKRKIIGSRYYQIDSAAIEQHR